MQGLRGLIMTDSGRSRIGISLDVKPHAYDPHGSEVRLTGIFG